MMETRTVIKKLNNKRELLSLVPLSTRTEKVAPKDDWVVISQRAKMKREGEIRETRESHELINTLVSIVLITLLLIGGITLKRGWDTTYKQTQVEAQEIKAGTYQIPTYASNSPVGKIFTMVKNQYDLNALDKKLGIDQ